MNNNKLRHFEDLLEQEKSNRLASLNDKKLGVNASLRDITQELSTYDNHPGDIGTETFEAEKNFSFKTSDKFFIGEIEAALQKMDEGKYGLCEVCKAEIGEERLELLPYARFCVDCEEEFESKPQDEEEGRPIEEQVLIPPFGRSFTDDSIADEVGYDGEDAWQDVNIYNVQTSDNEYDQEDSFGYVEEIEQISNQQYKRSIE